MLRGPSPLWLVLSMLNCPTQAQVSYEFGFGLNPTAQGGLHALFIYTIKDGAVLGSIPLRSDFFVLQASGMMESKANLESIDLFYEYGIRDCGVWASNGVIDANLDCRPLKDIWKLRYKNGMGVQDGTGWAAEEFRPSERQQIILQFYRPPEYVNWQGPYFGRDAFRLLRDMQDPAWVETYQNGG